MQATLFGPRGHEPHTRKRVRAVSKRVYAELRDGLSLSARESSVLRNLAHHYNLTARWPTASELARFMWEKGEIPRPDSRLVAPRLTFLSAGEKQPDGSLRGGSVIEALPPRRCRVTGATAAPWRIREAGSQEPR